MSESPKYRLVTRSDFDGLVSAVLFKSLDLIDEILFVHPKDMQDGKIEITARDITTNLPYTDPCHLAFDHHASEELRRGENVAENHVLDPQAASAARVVYDYYGGPSRFPQLPAGLIDAVDKGDSAQFSKAEILEPTGWVLLNFLMDPRTGLGRFRDFRISNYQLMMLLIDYCAEHTVDQILELPDVKERVEVYAEHATPARDQIRRCAEVHYNVVVLDLREEQIIHPCNRFVVYALFPDCNITVHVLWGLRKQNTVFAIGKSILNRSCTTDIGRLTLSYGGGGHANAGTCQVANEDAERVRAELIQRINEDARVLA